MEYKIYKLKYKYIDMLIFLYKIIKNTSPKMSKRLEKSIINKTKQISDEFYNILKR